MQGTTYIKEVISMGRASNHGIKCGCMGCYMEYVEGLGMEWDSAKGRYVKPRRNRSDGGWSPRTFGSIDGNDVTIREGTGSNEGHTLISDGQKSDRSFRRGHNHYGPKREGGGRVDDDRGHYTGPGR